MQKISYALGLSLGNNLKNNGIEKLDYQELAKGIQDVFEAKQLEMTEEEAQTVLNDFFQAQQTKMEQKAKEEGVLFLIENAKRAEVTTLPSGLQYEILTKGNGDTPKSTDNVKVHYHGTLINGTVFDSSVNRGEPATFGVTQVISGWVEALQLMSVGSKWKLYIPSNLAYGERGAGGSIPPHTTLIFEVELLDII